MSSVTSTSPTIRLRAATGQYKPRNWDNVNGKWTQQCRYGPCQNRLPHVKVFFLAPIEGIGKALYCGFCSVACLDAWEDQTEGE